MSPMTSHVTSRFSFPGASPIPLLFALVLLLLASPVQGQDAPRFGLKIRTLSAELRKQHNVAEDVKGALVTAVEAGSPAQQQGLLAGDVILEVEGKPVTRAKAVASAIARASKSGKSTISFKVTSANKERRDVTLPLPQKPSGSASPLPGPK
jgi:S1-C subfamily serine protease